MKYAFLILALFVSQILFSQPICFRGMVYDHPSEDIIPLASVFLISGEDVIASTHTDGYGRYELCTHSPLPLAIRVSIVGYDEARYHEARYLPGDTLLLDIPLQAEPKRRKKEGINGAEITEIILLLDRVLR